MALLSARASPRLVGFAAQLGASGYFSKREPLDRLIDGVRRLIDGESCFPAGVDVEPDERSTRLSSLSAAQLTVLRALARGEANQVIAHGLGVSEGTIKQHVSAIFRKLGVTNRTQAVLALHAYAVGAEEA